MERRLTAVMAADVVGYARLMGQDETATLRRLKSLRKELVEPSISGHGGRIVKLMGDGLLAEFPSVVQAVTCAAIIQRSMIDRETDLPDAQRIQLRIGLNLGDIIIEGADIYGDGVNVAARLESLAEPGGICVSAKVHEEVRDRLDIAFQDMGEQTVKNIIRPVRVWRWTKDAPPAARDAGMQSPKLTVPDKPSIAVLPFDNMSGDPDQEFFADGIAEDVITALSRFRSLFVIARNSSFTYKGRAVVITQVGRELGVRYVVEGSVRKAGHRVRITAQLIDATSGNHLWADRFDGNLDDIFDLQDQITKQIVIAIEPEIEARERERARRKPPESLDAWELFQRGLSHLHRINKADQSEAIRLFQEAIALDAEFSAAHAYLGYAVVRALILGYVEDKATALASARASAERATSLDPNEPMAHFCLGRVHTFAGENEMAIDELKSAIALNPNFALGYYGLGFSYYYGAGQAVQAIPQFNTALQLDPRGPMRWITLMIRGSALRFLGRHEEAIASCRQACQVPESGYLPYMHLAAALAEAGNKGEAQTALAKAVQRQSNLSISSIRDQFINRNETTLKSLLESLRKAGLPE